ncbi:class I SAM-dependent methyltransferase [Actinomyces dentalis]|mgnify:FL=1|uniref:class I SAM-dependent methyltransferase n=1 Tax=Actinomyces dentalis TaxID=272548 RepID=UPI00040C463C|nr:methyltransferase [Actinomyces dentalis]
MSGTSATYWNHNSAFHDEFVADAARRGGRALDVGCGEGLLVQRLAAVCEEAVGIEADPATVERARARLAGVRGAVVRRADALDPALRGEVGVFRTVTCVAVLHHLPLEEGLRALSGFVAPGGRLCVVGLAADEGLGDRALSALSVLPNWVASRWHREVRDIGVPVAPPRESLREIRAVAARVLPGCRLRRRMYWRYRLTWDRPGAA